MAITFVRDFRIAVLCLDPKFWTSLRASATRGNFSVGPEHVVGGIHGLLSEVVLLLLEAADLPPLLAGDSLGVFKQEVLHVPRCGNVWQGGLSLAHLLECQTWRVPVITFSVLKLSRFCWCSPSLMMACIWKSLGSVPQPRKRVIPTFPLTPLHPPTKQFSWPLVATKRLLSVHLVMSLVLITWKIFLPSHISGFIKAFSASLTR